jgi:hypothetical protein
MGDFHPELQVNGFEVFNLIAPIFKSMAAIRAAVSDWTFIIGMFQK